MYRGQEEIPDCDTYISKKLYIDQEDMPECGTYISKKPSIHPKQSIGKSIPAELINLLLLLEDKAARIKDKCQDKLSKIMYEEETNKQDKEPPIEEYPELWGSMRLHIRQTHTYLSIIEDLIERSQI